MFRALLLALLVSAAAPPLARATPKKPAKVVLIGIDGVSLNLLEPYIARGVTPNLGKLAKMGSRGNLESIWPLRTPQVWTTSVTGKLPGQHGIWDHLSNTYFNPPEFRTRDKIRVTSADRKSKTLWQLLGATGLKTLTVGWMATWPAETIPNGVMVAPVELPGDPRQTTIKGSFYSNAEKMVAPASLTQKVRSAIVDPSTISDADLAPFADPPPPGDPFYEGLGPLERYAYGLRWSLARARSVEAITLGLLPDATPDVLSVYFQCPDSLLHRFWIFHKGPDAIRERLETHGLPTDRVDELSRRFENVVEACYRDVDERVGRILAATQGPDTLVMVISDHGFGNAPIPHRMKDEPYSGDHLDEGVLLAAGPGIAAGSTVRGASVLDITPTLLHWLGQPVAGDMGGRVIPDFFNLARRPIDRIATYEAAPQADIPYREGWPPRKKPRRSVANN